MTTLIFTANKRIADMVARGRGLNNQSPHARWVYVMEPRQTHGYRSEDVEVLVYYGGGEFGLLKHDTLRDLRARGFKITHVYESELQP